MFINSSKLVNIFQRCQRVKRIPVISEGIKSLRIKYFTNINRINKIFDKNCLRSFVLRT